MLSAIRRSVPLGVRLVRSPLVQRCIATGTVAVPPQYDPIAAEKGRHPVHSHGTLFKVERYVMVGLLPLMPAAYFFHGYTMDMLLTFALTLHVHWGVWGVINDYGRPYVLGDTLAKLVRVGAYMLTACLLAGLLSFNTHDVGLTKAFEMVWSL